MSSPVLTTEQKTFVVHELAVGRSGQEVATAVRETFGIVISRQSAWYYSPESNRKCPDRWRNLFYEIRKEFTKGLADIALFHQAYRLRELQESLHRIKQGPRINEPLLHKILEQAAKEVGGMFTNLRAHADDRIERPIDAVTMANEVLRGLVLEDGFTKDQAAAFVIDHYKVCEHVLDFNGLG